MAKHDKTLADIFERPTRADLRGSEFAGLVRNQGGTVEPAKGNGSRLLVKLNGHRATFHRPHPGDIMAKVLVEDVREFLERAGVKPEAKAPRKAKKGQENNEANDGTDS
ncbi:MAG TPA: hexulose-6-phosphate synthase [Oscillatoriaceae cyanobacterium]